jgi:hypothetical protein
MMKNMALFKRKHVEFILQGRKTQTRRIHSHEWRVGRCYSIRGRLLDKPEGHIIITRKFKQQLGDISEVDAQKEGYSNLEEFKQIWTDINGSWNPEQIVTAYEFKLLKNIKAKENIPKRGENYEESCW